MSNCKECDNEFTKKAPNQLFCCTSCRNKDRNRRPSYKKAQVKYTKSDKRAKWQSNYYNTDLYKAYVIKMKSSPDYKERRQANYLKYQRSIKGKLNSIKSDAKRKHNLSRVVHRFTAADYETKLIDTCGVCVCCGIEVGLDKLTLDHIVPISKAPDGFEYTIKDVQFLCKRCNCKKGNKYEK